MTKTDLHIHSKFSATSQVTIEDVAAYVEANQLRLATVTDFGTIDGYRRLCELAPDCVVLPGLEVRAPEGDFLVFTTDVKYLAKLETNVDSVRAIRRDEHTAVIWAHPCVNQRAKTYEASVLPEVEAVVPYVDGLELFNGTMLTLNRQHLLRTGYFQNLMRIATDFHLAMTAGSDAHEVESIGHCATAFPDEVADAATAVAAIKARRVIPQYDHRYFEVRIPLG